MPRTPLLLPLSLHQVDEAALLIVMHKLVSQQPQGRDTLVLGVFWCESHLAPRSPLFMQSLALGGMNTCSASTLA